ASSAVAGTGAPAGAAGSPLAELVVAAAAPPTEVWALNEMGFDVRTVNANVLNDGFDYGEVDALYVSSRLSWGSLDDDARNDMTSFLRNGGGFVGRGRNGANLNASLGLLDAPFESGRGDGNGVINVANSGSALTAGATRHS